MLSGSRSIVCVKNIFISAMWHLRLIRLIDREIWVNIMLRSFLTFSVNDSSSIRMTWSDFCTTSLTLSSVKARSANCSNKLDTAERLLKESLLSAMRSFAVNESDDLWAELQISWYFLMKALLVSKQIDSTFFFTLSSHANAYSLVNQKYNWVSIDLFLHIIQSLKWLKRWSILSAFFIDEYIAWKMHHDFIIKKIFLNFMWLQMLSICNSEEIKSRSMMIMNNAKIHQSIKLNELCKSFEMHFVKLSLYSSDYNFIKSLFSMLKTWIKRNDKLVQWYSKFNKKFDEFLKVAVRSQRKWVNDSETLFYLIDIIHIFRWYLDINRLIIVKLIMLLLYYLWIII